MIPNLPVGDGIQEQSYSKPDPVGYYQAFSASKSEMEDWDGRQMISPDSEPGK